MILWIVILLAAACPGMGLAAGPALQEQGGGASGAEEKANVVLAGGSGAPGEAVVVPIYFSPPAGTAVGSLKLVVNFISANLKFEKLDRGIAAEIADASVTASLALGKNDTGAERSTLTVSAASAAGPAARPLPSGLLGYISLRISPSGRPANITLHTSVEAAELGTGKKLENLRTEDTTVDVIAPGSEPLVSCFFFTH